MPAAERDALRKAFAAEIEAGRYGETFAAAFRVEGWKALGVKSLFRGYVATKSHILGTGVETQTLVG